MHKNAIKNERGVNFSEILPQKLVIFPLFWAFLLISFVTFWLRTLNFQEKFYGNITSHQTYAYLFIIVESQISNNGL